MHSLAQKLTIDRMKKEREEIEKSAKNKPIDVPVLPKKKKTCLELFKSN